MLADSERQWMIDIKLFFGPITMCGDCPPFDISMRVG